MATMERRCDCKCPPPGELDRSPADPPPPPPGKGPTTGGKDAGGPTTPGGGPWKGPDDFNKNFPFSKEKEDKKDKDDEEAAKKKKQQQKDQHYIGSDGTVRMFQELWGHGGVGKSVGSPSQFVLDTSVFPPKRLPAYSELEAIPRDSEYADTPCRSDGTMGLPRYTYAWGKLGNGMKPSSAVQQVMVAHEWGHFNDPTLIANCRRMRTATTAAEQKAATHDWDCALYAAEINEHTKDIECLRKMLECCAKKGSCARCSDVQQAIDDAEAMIKENQKKQQEHNCPPTTPK